MTLATDYRPLTFNSFDATIHQEDKNMEIISTLAEC